EIIAMVADIGYKLKKWTEGLLKYLSQAEAKQPGLENQVESIRRYYKYYVDKELIKTSNKLLYDILQGSPREAGLIDQLTGITQHPGIFLKNLKATQDLIEDLKLKAARLEQHTGAEPAGASSAVAQEKLRTNHARILAKLEELRNNSGLPISTVIPEIPVGVSDNALWAQTLRALHFEEPVYRRVEREAKTDERYTGVTAFANADVDKDIMELRVYDVSEPDLYSIRKGEDVRGFILQPNTSIPPEAYFMHRGVFVSRTDIQKTFYDNKIRFDITVIPPSIWGVDFAKTVGHYHDPIDMPEIYQVVSGEVLWLMQKCDERGNVVDFITVKAKAGDIAIMLPGYGHVSVNISETEPLVMANWLTWHQSSYYGSFKEQKGAAYYVIKNNQGQPELIPNQKYLKTQGTLPQPRQMAAKDQIAKFGLKRGRPIYNLVKLNDKDFNEKIRFLYHPNEYGELLTPEATLDDIGAEGKIGIFTISSEELEVYNLPVEIKEHIKYVAQEMEPRFDEETTFAHFVLGPEKLKNIASILAQYPTRRWASIDISREREMDYDGPNYEREEITLTVYDKEKNRFFDISRLPEVKEIINGPDVNIKTPNKNDADPNRGLIGSGGGGSLAEADEAKYQELLKMSKDYKVATVYGEHNSGLSRGYIHQLDQDGFNNSLRAINNIVEEINVAANKQPLPQEYINKLINILDDLTTLEVTVGYSQTYSADHHSYGYDIPTPDHYYDCAEPVRTKAKEALDQVRQLLEEHRSSSAVENVEERIKRLGRDIAERENRLLPLEQAITRNNTKIQELEVQRLSLPIGRRYMGGGEEKRLKDENKKTGQAIRRIRDHISEMTRELRELKEHETSASLKTVSSANSSPLVTKAPVNTGGIDTSLRSVSIPDGNVGGIDFKHKAMASATTYEAMGSFVGLDFSLPKLSSQALLSFNLDKEQSDISQAIDNGIIVSGQRIKEFMAASAVKGGLEQRRETVITWLAKLGILEEITCCTQESSKEYREALVIADSAVI
ncbi:MAG: glucose-6-phosphate isomerase family protein, partial [Candidatus Omnitrophota bacterium]